MSLIIKNAVIVNVDKTNNQTQDILIEKGIISEIKPLIKDRGIKTIDAKGKLVMPGLIDIHVHLREPGQEYKETIETGSRAAAKGGFTTILCMPNTKPPVDNGMIVEGIIKEAKKVGLINVIPVGAITKGRKGEELADIFELKEAGCLAITDDGVSVYDSQLMRLALVYAKMVGILVMDHCQDPHLFKSGIMNEGDVSTLLGLKGDPEISETVIVARNIELSRYLNSRIHLQHISTKRSVELIKQAKSQGIQVSAEACPHHFALTEDIMKSFNTNAKVNPPLRKKEDIEAIKGALKDGTIDCIASDHAPHAFEDKEVDLEHAPYGIIGLETSVGLTISELVIPKYLTLSQMVYRMSYGPARLLGLSSKGEIKGGFDADITIIDADKEWEVKREDFVSKSKNSPFIGKHLKGCVNATICSGKVVYQAK